MRYSYKMASEYAGAIGLELFRYQMLGDRKNYYYVVKLSNSNETYTSLKQVVAEITKIMEVR